MAHCLCPFLRRGRSLRASAGLGCAACLLPVGAARLQALRGGGAARRVQSWRVYNREALDFDILFAAEGAKDLEARLAAAERAGLPLVWRAGQNDWEPYIRAHFDQIRYFFLQQPQYKAKCLPAGEA